MPRRGAHLAIAASCGALVAYVNARQAGSSDPFPEILGGALGALATATLPDALEPATSPAHRAGAHSLAAGGLVSMAVPPCWRFAADCRRYAEGSRQLAASAVTTQRERSGHQASELASRFAAGFAIGLPVGLLSHLGSDAFTPKGLPLV